MPRSQELSQQPQLRFKVFLLQSSYCFGPQSYSIITKPTEKNQIFQVVIAKMMRGHFCVFQHPGQTAKGLNIPNIFKSPYRKYPKKSQNAQNGSFLVFLAILGVPEMALPVPESKF